MTIYEIPQVKKLRSASFNTQAFKVVGRRRRFHAWFRGWQDGRNKLYGPSSTGTFTDASHFLRKTRSHAESLLTECEGKLDAEFLRLSELKTKLTERLASISAALEELATNARGIRCERPTATLESHWRLLVFLFFAEFFFSYLNLMYADMGGLVVEAILSAVFSGCLIGLTRLIGQRYRRLPLAVDEPSAASVRVYIEIVFFSVVMILVLCGLTYLRFRGITLKNEAGGDETLAEASLFIIGFGFLGYAAWAEGQTEYSGPKYGTADMERKRRVVSDLLASVDVENRKIDAMRINLRSLFPKHVEQIRNIYMDQYRRNEKS